MNTESSLSLTSSSRLGNYEIIKTLGQGSFGKVKLARHASTLQKVALKIINRRSLANSDMAGRVEREIHYLKLLRHPHIIKLYEVITTPTDIIMVIEYAGAELFDYIVSRGKVILVQSLAHMQMPEDEARRFIQQIVCAIDYCHRHKIVHRDLKPEKYKLAVCLAYFSLLLDDLANVKIADFGLSNIMTDGNFLKTSCGSPNYAAPEVISGRLYAGPEVDIWSCGVILYVLLCGRLPFDDEFIPDLFKKINSTLYASGAHYRRLLSRMLVVNPIDRITIPEIMESKWFNINLPEYLKPAPERIPSHTLDENIVLQLSKTFACSIDDIREHLRQDQGDIKEAYLLLAENQNMRKDVRLIDAQNMHNFFAQSPPPWNHASSSRSPRQSLSHQHAQSHPGTPSPLAFGFRGDVSEKLPRSTIAILSSSLPSYHESYMKREMPDFRIEPLPTRKNRTRWHFGIRSRSPPLEVMAEICRALQKMGAEWTANNPDPFTIKCRWKKEDEGLLIHMDIQLYVLEPGSHLVDFKCGGYHSLSTGEEISKPAMSPFPFLDIATKLITSLV